VAGRVGVVVARIPDSPVEGGTAEMDGVAAGCGAEVFQDLPGEDERPTCRWVILMLKCRE
jgi:hypothetical protein